MDKVSQLLHSIYPFILRIHVRLKYLIYQIEPTFSAKCRNVTCFDIPTSLEISWNTRLIVHSLRILISLVNRTVQNTRRNVNSKGGVIVISVNNSGTSTHAKSKTIAAQAITLIKIHIMEWDNYIKLHQKLWLITFLQKITPLFISVKLDFDISIFYKLIPWVICKNRIMLN